MSESDAELFLAAIADRDLRAVLQYLGVPSDDLGTFADLRLRLRSTLANAEPFKLPSVGDTQLDLSKGVVGMEWYANASNGGVAGNGVAPQFGEGAGLSAAEERDLLRRLPLVALIALVAARHTDPLAALDTGAGVTAAGCDREFLVAMAASQASSKSAAHLLAAAGFAAEQSDKSKDAEDAEARRQRIATARAAQATCTVCGECNRELKPHWAPKWSDGLFCECELKDLRVRRHAGVDSDVAVWDSVPKEAAEPTPPEQEPRWFAATPADANQAEATATAAALERADAPLIEAMTCPSCMELFSDPVVLSCQHRLCLRCAQHHAHDKPLLAPENFPKVGEEREIATLICPVCDVPTGIGMAALNDLPKDTLLSNAVERYLLRFRAAQRGLSILAPEADWTSGVPCEICGERDASVQCDQCRVNYCVPCRAMAHPNKGKLATHTFTPLRPEAALSNAIGRYCKYHPEERLTLFSTMSGQAICEECNVKTHVDHPVIPLREAYESAVTKVNGQHESLKAAESKCRSRMESYADAAAAVRDEGQRLRVGIESSFAGLRAILGRQERALLEAVRVRENAARQKLRDAHVQVKAAHESLQRANTFAEAVLEEPDAADFTEGCERLSNDLAAVTKATEKEVELAGEMPVDVEAAMTVAKEAQAVQASLVEAIGSWDVLGGATAGALARRLKERAALAASEAAP